MADSDVRYSVLAALQEHKLRTRGVRPLAPNPPRLTLAASGPLSRSLLAQDEAYSEAASLRGASASTARSVWLIPGVCCAVNGRAYPDARRIQVPQHRMAMRGAERHMCSSAPFKDVTLGPRSSPQTYNTDMGADLTHKVHPRGTIGNEPRNCPTMEWDEIPSPGPADYLGPSQPSPSKKGAGFSKSKSQRFPAKLPARDEANSILNPQQGAVRAQHPRVVSRLHGPM